MNLKSLMLSFLFFLTCSISLHAQQKLDSLLSALNNHKKEDTVRLKLLNNISKEYQYTNPEKGLETADSAIALALKLNKQREVAYGYMMKGENFHRTGSSKNQALACYQKALISFEQLGNKTDIAVCINDIGNSYMDVANYPNALDYFQQALIINTQLNDKKAMGINFSNIGSVYNRLSEFAKALEYNQKALIFSEQAGDKAGIANRLQRIGLSYRSLGDYPKALESYQKSLNINEQLNYKPGMAGTLAEIGNLYNLLLNSTLALEYLQKSLTIYEALNYKEGMAISNQNIGVIYSHNADYPTALKYDLKALDMAEQLGNEGLQASCLLSIGIIYHFLENYFKTLEYYKRSLALAKKLQIKETILLNTNNIGEVYRDAPDSVLIKEEINPMNRFTNALEYFNRALKMAEEIGSLPSQRDIWHNINITYEKQNDNTKALESYKKFISLRDSITNNEKEKKITRLVMQNEFDKQSDSIKLQQQIAEAQLKEDQQQLLLNEKELDISNKEKAIQKLANLKTEAELSSEQLQRKEKEKQLTIAGQKQQLQKSQLNLQQSEIKSNLLQRNLFIAGSVFLVIILFFIFRNYVNQRKANGKLTILNTKINAERQKSEDLLLNILPAETTEELKVKGYSEARQFDKVTVLFTDFVNFSGISENLSPKELVDEINYCFKAFDDIITSHQLEKIKTIGDAYLAVCGLPASNDAHAVKTAEAAISIRDFVRQYIEQRKSENRPYFQLRIGINSGVVVAGIVGLKKYAYDIWGDTVNIAARMEQNSEPGKINISGSTYQLVKDHFSCEYRGKISAKNKGELDMYFVNDPLPLAG